MTAAQSEALEFETWKTIKLDTRVDDLRSALKNKGVHIGSIGDRDVLAEFPVTLSSQETNVDLALVTPAEIGVDQVALREKIARDLYEVNNYRAMSRGRDNDTISMKEAREMAKDLVFLEDVVATAKDQGLELCPPEVAIQLCLQTESQPDKTTYELAMYPMYYPRFGFSYAFTLECYSNERRLGVHVADPKSRHRMNSKFIFRKSKASLKKRPQLTPEPVPTEKVEIPKILTLNVDYSKTLAEMIEAGGYDYVDPKITPEHFPNKKSGTDKITVELIQLNRNGMETDDIFKELDTRDLRPADLPELLSVGKAYKAYPKEDRCGLAIAALGTPWKIPNGRIRGMYAQFIGMS